MTTKLKFRLLALLPVLVISVDAFARAGGGGGKGSGGIIGLIIWGVYTLIISVILFFKVGKSRKVIKESAQQDSFWNFEQMRDNAKKVFFRMQDAWMERNIEKVKDIVTPSLYEDYSLQLELMKRNGEKNIVSGIFVSDVRIIGCEDYLDNSQDAYVAHIKGELLDYTVDEKSGSITKNPKKERESFTDTYHFIRKDNKWLLDSIDNKVSIWDVLKARNYHEENC
ncbi:Tim44 domain-containing protein [Alistipes sp. ZOR0009]|uniref:Tim44 domain-containing protein n=1 Tax=Alistipes sp. ZOR0009 TaxID=1339253 RepID=UPI000645F324|nr:Tim44-like domain-containing protein [Alistipes sp. ZOR0009]